MTAAAQTLPANKLQFKALTQAAFRLNNLLTAERDRLAEDLGLTSARWQVLETVSKHSTRASAPDVAGDLQISRQAVQRVLKDLADLGLVLLRTDANDKRAKLIVITGRGSKALAELDKRSETLRRKFFDHHSTLYSAFVELTTSDYAIGLPNRPPNTAAHDAVPASTNVNQWATRPEKALVASSSRTFETIQGHILSEIRSGELRPTDRLPPERELADSLGVSRSAVREALRSLEMSGVLSFKRGAGGGAFVTETSPQGIDAAIRSMLIMGRLKFSELLEVRAALIGQCARLGAERGTKQDFARLGKNIDDLEHRLQKFKKSVLAIEQATEFYRLTARASHNPLLILLIDAIVDLVAERLTLLNHRPPASSIIARREMLNAMRERRADDAASIIRLHARNTNRLLLKPAKQR